MKKLMTMFATLALALTLASPAFAKKHGKNQKKQHHTTQKHTKKQKKNKK